VVLTLLSGKTAPPSARINSPANYCAGIALTRKYLRGSCILCGGEQLGGALSIQASPLEVLIAAAIIGVIT